MHKDTPSMMVVDEIQASIRGQVDDPMLFGQELSKCLEKIWKQEDKE